MEGTRLGGPGRRRADRQNYLRSVADLTRQYGGPPDSLTLKEVEAYLIRLREACLLAPESVTTVVTGLRFFGPLA